MPNRKLLPVKFEEKILGFKIQFFTYPQLINLFEEIFIYQVYNFKSQTPTPYIIDCGSNIGISVLYLKKRYPNAHILAFEPDKEAFFLLNENIKRNNLVNVTTVNCALSDQAERTTLHKISTTGGSLKMSLIESTDKPVKETIYTEKLSNYIERTVDMIKIDVEGSEIKIINELLESKKIGLVNVMLIEYHPKLTKIPVANFSKKIIDHGFECKLIEDMLHRGATEIMVQCYKKAT